jgi:hypothetical protein
VNYAGKATNPRYRNRRAKMWLKGAEAIRNGAQLPPIDKMVPELTEPTYTWSRRSPFGGACVHSK